MKKLIKLDFNNTTRERKTEDSYSELYSHDKNNGSFEFEILNDTLTTEQVIALFKFTESNKIWKTTGTVEGNKVKVTFDTSLITQNETVICFLYFDEEQRTSDTFRFKFKVKVSEIDKMNRYEVKERFINNTVIVDRLDVVTKDELKEVLKNVGGIATEGLLTEVKAEELYAKKSEAVDNTNFELVKNRVLALELKTDKDTAYDDSDLRNRVVALETKEDKDTKYDDTEVKHRLTELENKPVVDTSFFVTEEKLNSKGYISDISGLATKQELANVVTKDELEAKHYVTEEELNNKAYLTQQNLDNYALKSELPTPYNDSLLNERVTALESKAIEGGAYDDTDLRNRVINLENKPALDTSEFVTNQALESRGYIKDVSNLVTKDELEGKHYISDISNLVTKEELESKNYLTTPYNDTPLKERVEVLENKVDKDTIYNDAELRNRVEVLENKPNVDLSNYVTNEQLENKGFIKQHQELSHLATTSDLEALRNIAVSKAELSKKLDMTEYNSFKDSVVTKTELAEKGYLTTHQDISNLATKQEVEDTYAKKTDLPTPYNDSALVSRINVLEAKTDNDTVYNDTEVKERLTALESKPTVDTSNLVTKDELNTLKPNQTLTLNNGTLSISGGNSVELPVNRYEIHGTGMPNGVVEAEIGTTYVDKNKTNGAFKWIKTTDGGNQGWEVLTGDTGWRTLNSVSKLGNSFVKIRRVNNLVTYNFGGLQWGWFGIIRRGGAGYNAQPTDLERNCFVLNHNQVPEGFRTPNSLIGSIYDDNGVPYGTWYIGNPADANHLRFQFLNPVPTDRDIGDIRVSTISYFTDEPWPTQLP